ncbi:MAG TPA: hypothetical protein VFA10_11510 [Ktedonobacteraceae bacterium]|nr:hypothetical protein [Ktedonobacteraceae bacterium]
MATVTVFVICLRGDLDELAELLDGWLADGDFYADDSVVFDADNGSTDKLHHRVITCQFPDEAPEDFIELLKENDLVFDFIINNDGGEQ